MKRLKNEKIIYSILVVLTLLPCIYALYEHRWGGWEFFHMSMLALGNLLLIIRFCKKIFMIYHLQGIFMVLKKVWGYMFIILVGGNWLVQIVAIVVLSISKYFISAINNF